MLYDISELKTGFSNIIELTKDYSKTNLKTCSLQSGLDSPFERS